MELSIIIPVYNAAPWLERCLDSLLDQGLDDSDYEIILVDDGSTDDSPRICQRYVSSHPNIFCHRQTNSGQSAARNRGLALARGKWIGFVDADDYLVRKGLAKLLPFCSDDIDGIRFNSTLIDSKTAIEDDNLDAEEVRISFRGDGKSFLRAFNLEVFCWSWLYRKRFLDQSGISFPAAGQGEDLFFLYRFLTGNPNIISVPLDIYRYIVHEGSITTRNDKVSCRECTQDMTRILTSIREDLESYRESDRALYGKCLDSIEARMPMLFARILKSGYSLSEYKLVLKQLREARLIPLSKGKGHPVEWLSKSAIRALTAFPALYVPAKGLYTGLFQPYIYPRINRNR